MSSAAVQKGSFIQPTSMNVCKLLDEWKIV